MSYGLKIQCDARSNAGISGAGAARQPIRGIRLEWDALARVRYLAESDIVVALAGPEAQRRHSPRSWRTFHGAYDFKQAVDLATRFNSSKEAVKAYPDWLGIVTRDEITLLWPHAEAVAHALVREQTLTAAEITALLAAQRP